MTDQLTVEGIKCLLKTIGMAAFSLCQCFKPVSYFIETLIAGYRCHARVHVRVFAGFTCNGSLQVVQGIANRQASCRITGFFQVLEMTVGMPASPSAVERNTAATSL